MGLRYALIGCGRIAPSHITAALAQKGSLQIAAICDNLPENMQKLLDIIPEELRGDVKLYTDYRIMLNEVSADLCAIATESGKHASIALDCINAGAHVIIEKPIALSLKDADAIIALGKAKNRIVCACHQNRFNSAIQKTRKTLEEGNFGRLFHATAHVRWSRNEDYYRQAPWRGTWEQDGGTLMNQCIHSIDLMRWMMGDDVTEVFAYTDKLAHPYMEAEDIGLAIMRFRNGSYGLLEGTVNIYPSNLEETLCIFGERGTVKLGGKSVNMIEEWIFESRKCSEIIKAKYAEAPDNIYGFGHARLYGDMIDSIQLARKPCVDGEAGRRALELVLAIYRSAKEGGPVKLPMDDYSTMDLTDMEFNAGRIV